MTGDFKAQTRRGLLAILAAALLLRLGWCLHLPRTEASLATLPDQVEYLECGRNLLHGQGLSFVDPRFGQRVFAYRMPGYPLLVAACGGNVLAVRITQCLLDASTVLAIYLLARKLLTANASLIAAGLVAINPFQIYFCGLILSESLFIALLIWGITLLPLPVRGERAGERAFASFFCIKKKRPGRLSPLPSPRVQAEGKALLAVLILSTTALVRPSATLLPLVLTAATRRWHWVIHAALIEALLLSVWANRNHAVVGEYIFTTTNSGISAYDGLNPSATGASDQRFIAEMPQLQSMTETQRDHDLAQRASDFAGQHPLTVLKLAGIKLARLWSPVPLSHEYGSNLKLIAVALIYSVPLDLLVSLGLFFGRLPQGVKLFLLAPALYFSVVHAVGVGSLRYRIPADVPLTILAASGAGVCVGRKKYGQASANS